MEGGWQRRHCHSDAHGGDAQGDTSGKQTECQHSHNEGIGRASHLETPRQVRDQVRIPQSQI